MNKFAIFSLVAATAVCMSACGTATPASVTADTVQSVASTVPTEPPAPTPEPAPDLTGVWRQVDAGDSYQQATIAGNTIEITWESSDISALYWAGTFVAPTTATEPYTWESTNDTSKTNNALMASSDATKKFNYENGNISYEVSAMGTTTTLYLEKADDEISAPSQETIPNFSNGTVTTEDYTIVITDYKVIQPGNTGNEYGEKPVIAFWYDTTNNGDQADVDPITAWTFTFDVVQDNDPNAVNSLNAGMLPDDQYMDSQMQKIKPGGTVSNAVAYELDDETTPVTLTASAIGGTPYGSQEFEITQ